MTSAHDDTAYDTCAACSVHQACCKDLNGLRLTREEYERLFARFSDRVQVEDRGLYFLLTSVDAGPCPHWTGKCSVYLERPVECRLYPHTITHIEGGPQAVAVHVHSATGCPGAAALTHPPEVVADLCRQFVDATPLRGRPIEVHDHGSSQFVARMRSLATRAARRLARA